MDIGNQKLTNKIMKRVIAIWFLRQVAPVLVATPLSLGLVLWLAAKEFFVAKIVENFIISVHGGGIQGVFSFISSALTHAPLLPTATIGFFAGLSLILGYRLARNFTQLSLVRN